MAGAATAIALGLLLTVAAPADPQRLTVAATDAVVGDAIHATAELSESPEASGEISFEVFGPGDEFCSGPALAPAPSSASVTGEGQYESGEITPPTAGAYYWSAHYSGDSENAPADSACSAISSVGKASPGMTGSASGAAVGAAIHDEATLTGGFLPTGEVTFSLYGPGDSGCSAPLETASVPLQAGQATSADFIAQQAGEFRWTAEYEGDANNEAVSLGCGAPNQASSVEKVAPVLVGTASSAAKAGLSIGDSVTLSGGFGASGQLVFRAYGPGDASCTTLPAYEATVPVSGNDTYAPAGFAPGAGLYRWTVGYGGDGNNEAVSLGCGAPNQASTVGKASPTLAGTASSVKVGQTITDSVTLGAGFTAGGQLHFSAYGPGDSSCADPTAYEATVPVAGNGAYAPPGFAPGAGLYRWTVSYTGDANNEAVSLGCGAPNQASTVGKASPTLVGTATTPVKVGQTITDSVTLAERFGTGGQLVFRAYGPGDSSCSGAVKYEASVPLGGNGTYAPAGFAPGAGLYRWTVGYGGDGNNEAVSLGCGAPNQASTVDKASPTLVGTASSVAKAGLTITDSVALAERFGTGGQLVFRAYGPNDSSCSGAVKYEASVPLGGNGTYAPAGFAPGAGLYLWTVGYAGDANNEAVSLGCGAANQRSAVEQIPVTLAVDAGGGTIGDPVSATATIGDGAIPTGQITFKAFPPGDPTCAGAAAFSSTVNVSGNGQYRSQAFAPSRVGPFRWTVEYSGDVNHIAATAGCGKAASTVTQAAPSIAGAVVQRVTVGTSFQDTATLRGGYSPGGTITFQIYGPVASGCTKPAFVDTVAIAGNGTFSSDPFVAPRPGRYSFVATYSGNSANRGATEPCDSASQVVVVQKRAPKVKPRARLIEGRRISIRANLSGGVSPSGTITFRLYGPGDRRCRHKPAFSGGTTVKSNGNFSLAQYLAPKAGIYRLSVGYSGDQRNRRYKGSCSDAQPIHIGS
jgi:hypothetical protein